MKWILIIIVAVGIIAWLYRIIQNNDYKQKKGWNNRFSNMDTEMLLVKLKNIANDRITRVIHSGAMCYEPVAEEEGYRSCKCSYCQREIGNFEVNDYLELIIKLGNIKKTKIAEVKIVCIDCLIRMCQSEAYHYDLKTWDIYNSLESEYKFYNNIETTDIDGEELLDWKRNFQKRLREQAICTEMEKHAHPKKDAYIEPEYIVFLFKGSSKTRITVINRALFTLDCFLAFIHNKRKWRDGLGNTVRLKNNIIIIERLTGLKI